MCARVELQQREKDTACFWQTLLGIRLSVCIQAVFAAAPAGVVRKRKCTLQQGLLSTGSKFANLLNPSDSVALLSNRMPSWQWQSWWGGAGRWRVNDAHRAKRIFGILLLKLSVERKELSQQYHCESFLFSFFVFFTFIANASLSQKSFSMPS